MVYICGAIPVSLAESKSHTHCEMDESNGLFTDGSTVVSDKQSERRVKIIFVLGPPAAGKGTLCERLKNQFSCCHLSVGDHLRGLRDHPEAHAEDAFGGLSRDAIEVTLRERRLLAPDPLVAIIQHKLKEESSQGNTLFVIDGFPRSDASAELFEKKVISGRLTKFQV